jgi:hypothetical protein
LTLVLTPNTLHKENNMVAHSLAKTNMIAHSLARAVYSIASRRIFYSIHRCIDNYLINDMN